MRGIAVMVTANKTPIVRHEQNNHLFYLKMEGLPPDMCPRTEYAVLGNNQRAFYHTETPDNLRHKGYATAVVKEALTVATDRGIDTSKSSCPFVKSVWQSAWIRPF